MARFDAVLFDFDGVLADTEPIHYACWCEILRPMGIEVDWDTYRTQGIGVTDTTFLEFLSRCADPPLEVERLRARYAEKRALFRERCLREPPVPSSIADLIKGLSMYSLAVVTSSNRTEVEPILVAAGIRSRLGAAVYGGDTVRHKPDPAPYLLAAERLGARVPLVVEDSDAGEASGRAAGYEVLRVHSVEEVPARVRAALR